jgi:biotin carboxylase
MKTLLILGGNKDSKLICEVANQMGLHTIVIDRNPKCEARKIANVFLEASCYHEDEVISVINGFDIHGVICAGIDAPVVAAEVAYKRGLIGPSRWTAEHSKNKIKQLQLFEAYNHGRDRWNRINIPVWKLDNPFVDSWTEGVMVCKPADSRGARGVQRLLPGESWQEARDYASKFSTTGETIFEKWIDGMQLSSESLVQNGNVMWTAFSERNYDKLDKFKPYVIEDGGDMPPDIPLIHENDYTWKASVQLQMCIDALQFRTGTIKGDLVWDGQDIHIIEVATRLSGGGYCIPQIPLCWGVPFVELAIRLALGEQIEKPKPRFQQYVCQRYFISDGVTKHPERGDWIVTTGATRKEARENAKDLLD